MRRVIGVEVLRRVVGRRWVVVAGFGRLAKLVYSVDTTTGENGRLYQSHCEVRREMRCVWEVLSE